MTNYKKCSFFLEKFIKKFSKKNIKKNIFNSNNTTYEVKYLNQCKEIVKFQRDIFIFDLEDLLSSSCSELKNLAFFNTQRFVEILNSTLIVLCYEYINNSEKKKFNFLNNLLNVDSKKKNDFEYLDIFNFQTVLIPPKIFPVETIESINASMIGKYTLIEGVCLFFSTKLIKLKSATYFCKFCGFRISSKPKESVFKPILFCFSKTCEKKHNRKLFLDINLSHFHNYSVMKISNENNQRSLFGELDIYVDNLQSKFFYPGIHIKCGGVLLPNTPNRTNPLNNSVDFFFNAMFIEKNGCDSNEKSFLIKQRHIFELLKSPNLYDRISNSLLPHFLWGSDLRKSIALAITSCSSYINKNKLNMRQQINVLLIGNFNIGKSSLLKILSGIFPKSTYINSFAKFMNRFFFQDFKTDTKFVQTDNLISKLYNNKLIFLENAFSLKENDSIKLNHLLDNQFRTKEGIIEYPTVIMSVPDFDRSWVKQDQRTAIKLNYDFIQKFDLVCFQEQKMFENFDAKVSEYLLETYGKEDFSKKSKNFVDENILSAFLEESTHIFPKFTQKSIEIVIYQYVSLKAHSLEKFRKKLNIRYLISMVKLSIALAKLNFKDLISITDIREASRMITFSITSIHDFQLSTIKSQSISNEHKIYNLIRKTSLRSGKAVLNLLYLSKLSSSLGFSREDFVKSLEIYENLNVWAISLKQMKLVFLI